MRKLKSPNYETRLRIAVKIEILMREKFVLNSKATTMEEKYDVDSLAFEIYSWQKNKRQCIQSYLNEWVATDKRKKKFETALAHANDYLNSSSNKVSANFPLRLSYHAVLYLFGREHKLFLPVERRFETLTDIFLDSDYDYDESYAAIGFSSHGQYVDWEIDRLLDKPD